MFLLVLLYFILIWPKLPTNQWSTWSHAGNFYAEHILRNMNCSDAGRWKASGVPVVIGGNNLPSPVGIGLTNLPNIGGSCGPPGSPGSGITELHIVTSLNLKTSASVFNSCAAYLDEQRYFSPPGWWIT